LLDELDIQGVQLLEEIELDKECRAAQEALQTLAHIIHGDDDDDET
jgi:hypothetical protein